MKKPLYIFDLDVVACVDWKPNNPVIHTMTCLLASGADIYIWSTRSQALRDKTNKWVAKHLSASGVYLRVRADADLPFRQSPPRRVYLRARADANRTSHKRLKQSWMNSLSDEKKKRLVAVFEKRNKAVAMWRGAGIACFQVTNGTF